MSKPFKILKVSREYLLVYQVIDDEMVLVDRLDSTGLKQEALEEAWLSLHNRCEVLNEIYRTWGPKTKGRECDETRPAVPVLMEVKS